LPLEIALLTLAIDDGGGGKTVPKAETPAQQEVKEDVIKTSSTENAISEDISVDKSNVVVQNYDGPLVGIDRVKTEWMDFLNVMSGSCGSLAGMLRLVSPVDVKGKSITLSVTSRFQQDMLERDVKKKLIEEQMSKIWGPMTFKCVLGEKVPPRTEPEAEDLNVEAVSSEVVEKIFGS
jgi:hypothetical protein